MSPIGRLLLIQTLRALVGAAVATGPVLQPTVFFFFLFFFFMWETQFSATLEQHGGSQQLTATVTVKVIENGKRNKNISGGK